MSVKCLWIICGLMMCLHHVAVNASPILNIRRLYDVASERRVKTERPFLQDSEVLELEHLKHKPVLSNSDDEILDDAAGHNDLNGESSQHFRRSIDNAFNEDSISSSEEVLPTLEKQLEAEAAKMNADDNIETTNGPLLSGGGGGGQLEKEEDMIVQHQPSSSTTSAIDSKSLSESTSTILSQHEQTELDNMASEQNAGGSSDPSNSEIPIDIPDINEKSPPPAKTFYGAARLAFGQNPEVLPTLSTTTTTTIMTTTSNQPTTINHGSNSIPTTIITDNGHTVSTSTIPDIKVIQLPEQIVSSSSASASSSSSEEHLMSPDVITVTNNTTNQNTHNHNKEIIEDDSIVAELEATKVKANVERRSVDRKLPKTAESLLKHAESSFDMAQYVFWTGDEAGVARAVEEFIQQGLMTRENALKFLREIRLGIDYLQKSYDNRVLLQPKSNDFKKNENHENHEMKSIPKDVNLNEKHFSQHHHNNQHNQNQKDHHNHHHLQQQQQDVVVVPQSLPQNIQQHSIIDSENLSSRNSNLQKTLDRIPSLARLQDIGTFNPDQHIDKNNNNDEDDMSGRARLADFLYTEYSLEEIVYQLAKVMFSQSLTHGSEQSQKALQRLTSFLESEGELGRISPSLQKKILDVLLAALSDTLANHPELLAAARANLGKSFHSIPILHQNTLESLKQ